jgi:hypothetical protein
MTTSDNADGYVLMELNAAARDRYRWIAFTVAALAMVFVALRVVARMKRGARMRIDDWILLGALVIIHFFPFSSNETFRCVAGGLNFLFYFDSF